MANLNSDLISDRYEKLAQEALERNAYALNKYHEYCAGLQKQAWSSTDEAKYLHDLKYSFSLSARAATSAFAIARRLRMQGR